LTLNNAGGVENKLLRKEFHYQQAIKFGDFNGACWRKARKTAEQTNDLDFIQGELTWEFAGTGTTIKTGMRF